MAIPVPFHPSSHSASRIMGLPSDPFGLELEPRRLPDDILVVEDNYMIALDLETMLRDLGVASVRTASSVHEGLGFIADRLPDLGLIDVNLGDDKCFEIAERLQALGVPFVFTTGYGDSYAFPAVFAQTRIMTKPYTLEGVRALLGMDA